MDGDEPEAEAFTFAGSSWEMVATGPTPTTYDEDFSIFPPSLHEGLSPTLTLTTPHLQESAEGLNDPSSPLSIKEEEEDAEEEEELPPHVRRLPLSDSARRLVESGLELIRSKLVPIRREGGCRGVVWSFAALAGLAGGLMYLKRRHWREKEILLFLIREKDQKIAHLMHQIAQMNEVIAARHRVAVLRRI